MTEIPKEITKRLAEIPCPEYYEMEPGNGGSCNKSCKAGCHGTGRRFWRLVQEVGQDGAWNDERYSKEKLATLGVLGITQHGTALVSVEPTVELAAEALDTSGYLFTIRNTPSMTMARFEVEVDGQEPIYSDNLSEALWQALAAAVEEKAHG